MQNIPKKALNNHPARLVSLRRLGIMSGMLASAWLLSGCTSWLQPGSKGHDNSKHVWTSPRSLPQTVQLIDTRDDSVLWEMEVPAGKWLVTKFSSGRSAGTALERPDRLSYRIIEENTVWTSLNNWVAVPPAKFRRWELTLREPAAVVVADPRSRPSKIPRIELPAPDQDEPTLESIDLTDEG